MRILLIAPCLHGLGMQSGSITVADAGLTIGFVPKPLS